MSLALMPFVKNDLIRDKYTKVKEQLRLCAGKHGRPLPDLMVVSKNQPPETIQLLLDNGHRLFGENRVQEATKKWLPLKKIYPDSKLHLIGRLQKNKVIEAIKMFDVIETVDRPSLVEEIAKAFSLLHTWRPLLIQVNTGKEPQKSGVLSEDFPSLLQIARGMNLPIQGLMCIPPLHEDPTPHFMALQDLAARHQLPWLSMGMSHDFPKAVGFGASWVRMGTALFG